MGTNTGTVMTLANGIIGVSILAMPFCFKQCGIALSILMLLCSNLVSRLACHFLLKAAIMARRRNFEFLAFHIFGSTGKFTAELFIIGFLMGTCIAFFVVMGDLGPAIISKALGIDNSVALRPSVLIGLAVFVVLPLGLLRNVDSLSAVCTATIGFYGCLVLKVVSEAMPHLLAGDWIEKVHFWRPAGIMQCIPIFSMALFCQTQLFEIYESLHNASLERMNNVIRNAVNMCTAVYISVGFFGYVAYYTQNYSGNIMMSFTPSTTSEMIKVGFVLSVAVSFPLVIFPCRASLYSLLFRRMAVPHHEVVSGHIPETRFKFLTVIIISTGLLVGLLIPNIELVLGLVGSTIGVLICVMFPAAAFIRISSKSSYERLLAQVLLFVGALILILGTYATLYAANEVVAAETSLVATVKPEIIKVAEKLPDPPDVVELPATAGVRQEPPVPVEPAPDLKVQQQAILKEEVNLVNQDAIRKEDEELAEAEKQAKDESEKKDAELLRKLEAHEEEQIKLLREQKEILQALQEHKKEIERSKIQHNLTGGVPPPQIKTAKEKDVPKPEEKQSAPQIIEKKDLPQESEDIKLPPKKQQADIPQRVEGVKVAEKLVSQQEEVKASENKNIPPQPAGVIIPVPQVNEVKVPENKDISPHIIPVPQVNEVRVPEKKNIPLQSADGIIPEKNIIPPIEKVRVPEKKDIPLQSGRKIIPEKKYVPQPKEVKVEEKKDVPPQVSGILPGKKIVPQVEKVGVPEKKNIPLQPEGGIILEKKYVVQPQEVKAVPPQLGDVIPEKKSVHQLEEVKVPEKNKKPMQADDIIPGPQIQQVKDSSRQEQPRLAKTNLPKDAIDQGESLQTDQKLDSVADPLLNKQPAVPVNFLLKRLKAPLVMKKSELVHDREKRDTDAENCAVTPIAVPQDKTQVHSSNNESEVNVPPHPEELDNSGTRNVAQLNISETVVVSVNTGQKEETVVASVSPNNMIVDPSSSPEVIKVAMHLSEPKLEPLKLEDGLQQTGAIQEAKPMKRDLKSVTAQQDSDE